MLRIRTLAAYCLALITPALALAETELFDGETLSGWQSVGDASWRVSQGAIEASGEGDGFLVSNTRYGDFHLSLEFWVDGTTNSGVFISCEKADIIHPDTCYEINIWDDHPQQEARTGAIVRVLMPPLARVESVGKWNHYAINKRGAHLSVRLNGVLTAELEDARPGDGFIALQHFNTGIVRFRHITLGPPHEQGVRN